MKTIIFILVLFSMQVSAIAQRQVLRQQNPTPKQIKKDSLARLSKLTPLDPNRTTKNKLVTQFKLSDAVADALIKGRPYRVAHDVYKRNEITSLASFGELATILAGARATLHYNPALPVRERKLYSKNTRVSYGHIVDVLGNKRYFIADSIGNEIISASPRSDSTLKIDITTMRFFGHFPWDLPHLLLKDRSKLYEILSGVAGKEAMNLWQSLEPKEQSSPEVSPISSLSQLLMVGYQSSVVEDCNQTNGCSSGPDFDFKNCCDEHDKCYCRGGDANAQEKCDEVFRKCISRKGYAVLDDIYSFFAATFGGASHVGPTIYKDTAPANTVVTIPQSGPVNCRVKVKLISVQYKGDYIGNDWTYSVAVDGITKRILNNGTHNHHATRAYGTIITNKLITAGCGSSYNLVLSANAREEDSLDDDKGSAMVIKTITCTPGAIKTFDHLMTVSVKEAISFFPDDHGKMYFLFRITTQCE